MVEAPGPFLVYNTFSCLIIEIGMGGEKVGVVAPSTRRFFQYQAGRLV